MANTSYSYQVKEGDSYWALARYVRDHSDLSSEAKNDLRLLKQLAEGIENDLQKNGVNSLQVGETVQLHSAEYYIPSLAIEKVVSYEVQQGDGYWTLARKVCEAEETADQARLNQVSKAIQNDLRGKGVTELKVGKKISLRSVEYYLSKSPPQSQTKTETDGAIGTVAQITQAQQKKLDSRAREKAAAERYEESKANGNEPKNPYKAYEIKEQLLDKKRSGKLRKTSDIMAIVVHQTGGTTAQGAIETFKTTGSAHYLVDKDGTILRLVPDLYVAFHVGDPSSWATNDNSIGIEFVGFYDKIPGEKKRVIYHDLTLQQKEAGKWLLKQLMIKYDLSKEKIFRHPEVSAKQETEAQSVEYPE